MHAALPELLVWSFLCSTGAVAVAWVITTVAHKLSAGWKHLIWFLAIVTPLLGFAVLASGFVVHLPWLPAASASSVSPATIPLDSHPVPVDTVAPLTMKSPASSVPVIPMVWVLGCGLWLAGLILAHLRVRSLLRDSAPFSPDHPALMLFDHPTARLVVFDTQVPFCYGLVRPVIVLPQTSLHWSAEKLRACLLHEQAHLRRGDLWTLALSQLACAVFWFNPLVWIAARKIRQFSEVAADDLVISGQMSASDFSHHLLKIAEELRDGWLPPTALSAARPGSLRDRLTNLLDEKASRTAPRKAATAVLSFTLAALLIVSTSVRLVHAASPETAAANQSAGTPSTSPAVPPPQEESLSPSTNQLPAVEGGFTFETTRHITFCGEPAFPVRLVIRQDNETVFQKDNITSSPVTIRCTLKPGSYMMQSMTPEGSDYWNAYGAQLTISEDGKATIRPQPMEHLRKMRPLAPKDLQVVDEKRPLLEWHPVEGADHYGIYWHEKDADTNKSIRRASSGKISDTKWRFDSDVTPGRIYEWSLFAYDKAGKRFAYYSSSYFKTAGTSPVGEAPLRGGDLKITDLTKQTNPDGSIVLGVDIASHSKAPIVLPEVKVYAYVYVQSASGEVTVTTGPTTPRWSTPPIDWTAGSAEHLDIITPSFASGTPEKFYGYTIAIYYQGRFQDSRSDPQSLAKDFPLPVTTP